MPKEHCRDQGWKRPWGRLLEALRVLMEALRVCRGSEGV